MKAICSVVKGPPDADAPIHFHYVDQHFFR